MKRPIKVALDKDRERRNVHLLCLLAACVAPNPTCFLEPRQDVVHVVVKLFHVK